MAKYFDYASAIFKVANEINRIANHEGVRLSDVVNHVTWTTEQDPRCWRDPVPTATHAAPRIQ